VRPSAAPRPLNRLPDVASILVLSPPPGSLTPPAAASAGSPTAPAVALPARPPGDTLASLAGPTVTEAPLLVEVMSGSTSPLGETLPSTGAKAHSYAPRGRGVAPVLVVVLVVGALIAGFLLGWAASAFLSAPH
jgi:hypothetical protein